MKTAFEYSVKTEPLRAAIKALEDIAKMKAEDNFKNWQDKVEGNETWVEEFLNTVVIAPINNHAKEALERIEKLHKQALLTELNK